MLWTLALIHILVKDNPHYGSFLLVDVQFVQFMHIKEKYPIVAETSIIVWEHFKQDAFATFTLSRIRLMRSTALNSFAMLIVCTYAVRKYHCGWKITMLTVVGFLTMAIASDLAHFNLLNNYYKKTMKLENSYLNKGDVKSSEKASSQS